MAGLFSTAVRPALLAAASSSRLRSTAERAAPTRAVVRRFIAGETHVEALAHAVALRSSGRMVSIDHLGEDVTDRAGTSANLAAYLQLLDALARDSDNRGEVCPVEVSVKLSALGQALERDGERIALANTHTICERAARAGVWVTVDAEDHTTTESTLAIVGELRGEFAWLGVAVQAYLKRALGDCAELAASGTRVRLCKGAYDEPASVAHRGAGAVRASYLRCLQALMGGAGYPMVASHDPAIITAAGELATAAGRGPQGFEYQMLYGVRDDEQRRLADAGRRVRVYLPFGTQWYGYFVRRLAERPANLAFFMRALSERRRTRSAASPPAAPASRRS